MDDRQELEAFLNRLTETMLRDIFDEGYPPPGEGQQMTEWLTNAQQFALTKPSAIVDSAASVLEAARMLAEVLDAIAVDTPEYQHAAMRSVIEGARLLGARELLHQMVKDGDLESLAVKRLTAEAGANHLKKLNADLSWWHAHALALFKELAAGAGQKFESIYSEIADRIEAIAQTEGKEFKSRLKDPAGAVKKVVQRKGH
jgi:hypothetical protein